MSEESDMLRHPEPDHLGDAMLEDQIETKLANLSKNQRDFQTRVLRIDRNRVQIHAHKRLTRRYQSAFYTPDQLAHQLTGELASRSPYATPDLAHVLSLEVLRNFLGRVSQILLIPELALSDRHLLTHIFCPGRRLLAVYLYPRRFDLTESAHFAAFGQPRLDVPPAVGRLGLLGSVIAAISQFVLTDDAAPTARALHKFIVPCELLSEEEHADLQTIHELYTDDGL